MSPLRATSPQSRSAVCPTTTAARLGTLKVTLVAAQYICRFHRLPDTEHRGSRKNRRGTDDPPWSISGLPSSKRSFSIANPDWAPILRGKRHYCAGLLLLDLSVYPHSSCR